MFRMVPPAGTPTSTANLVRMVTRRLGGDRKPDALELEVERMTGTRHCFSFNSGRSALTSLLRVMAEQAGPDRDEVIIPAYTCFSVPAAVVKAGLKIRLVDITPATLDYDFNHLERTDLSRVVAVVACNLFGIPNDIKKIRTIIGSRPIAVIDDAAQALGGLDDGAPMGSRGEAGIFSLGRGKNLSTYSGGLLVTSNDQLAERIARVWNALPDAGLISELAMAMKIGLTSWFLRPVLYWIPESLPFLGLGQTVFDVDFEVRRMLPIQNDLGSILIKQLPKLNDRRSEIATQVIEKGVATGSFEVPGYRRGTARSYLRLPLLARNRTARDAAIAAADKLGVKASIMYPSTIDKIPGIEGCLRGDSGNFPGADQVVERLLTLPTHGYVGSEDINKMINCLADNK